MRSGGRFILLISFCVSYIHYLYITHCVPPAYSWICPSPICSCSTALLALALACFMRCFVRRLLFLGGVCACVHPKRLLVSLMPWASRSVRWGWCCWGDVGANRVWSELLTPCTVAAGWTFWWALSVALPRLQRSWWISARSRFTVCF